MKKIKVAFVGAGYMANEHIKSFADESDVELVGIYSRTKSRAISLSINFKIKYVCNSIEELYNKTKANIIVVCVPILEIKNICFEIFKYPWMSLIEKPIGVDLIEANLILKEQEKTSSLAYVALNRRHYSSTLFALNEFKDDNNLRVINIFDQEDIVAAKKANHPEKVLKYWMYANSIHIIDYITMFGRGEIVSTENLIKWDQLNPNHVLSKINFSSGDIAIYQAVWNGPGPWAVSISSSQKRCELRPIEKAFLQQKGSRKILEKTVSNWDIEFKPGLRLQANEVLKAFRKENHNLPTIEDSIKTMKIIKNIYGI